MPNQGIHRTAYAAGDAVVGAALRAVPVVAVDDAGGGGSSMVGNNPTQRRANGELSSTLTFGSRRKAPRQPNVRAETACGGSAPIGTPDAKSHPPRPRGFRSTRR